MAFAFFRSHRFSTLYRSNRIPSAWFGSGGLRFAAILMASLLSGCDRSPVQFEPIKLPANDRERLELRTSARVEWFGKTIESPFQLLLRTGDRFGEHVFAQIVDRRGKPVRDLDLLSIEGEHGFESAGVYSDFTSLLEKDNGLFLVHHVETVPGAVYVSRLNRSEDGRLQVESAEPILTDHGIYNPCAGSVTPWGTHLGSEEYEPNAALRRPDGTIDARYNGMVAHFTGSGRSSRALLDVNPYWYGWVTEIDIKPIGPTLDKRYALGRFSVELAYVLPDRRTVYMTDDGKNVGFYMFIADRENDLSSGTLYAARWHQRESSASATFKKTGLHSANLEWISLGHADEREFSSLLRRGVNAQMSDGMVHPHFHDLFDTAPARSGRCLDGFRSINAGTQNPKSDGWEQECLRLRKGSIAGIPIERLASRLETRRYAAYLGATTEFRKEEGLTYDADRNVLYVAFSRIEKGMKKSSADDEGGSDHIQLAENICGAIYQVRLSANQKDASGNPILSEVVGVAMEPVLVGTPLASSDKDFSANECSLAGIAEPDNITYLQDADLLIIGEDSTHGHQNDLIWAYDLRAKRLTPILSSPTGAENTSVYWHRLRDGKHYMTAVVQHPFGEPIKEGGRIGRNPQSLAPAPEALRAYVGVFGPFR